MIWGRFTGLSQIEGGFFFLLLRSLIDLMEGEQELPVADFHSPVNQVLHHHLLQAYSVLYLVEGDYFVDFSGRAF